MRTREEWLVNAVKALRPLFKKRGYTIPRRVKVSCGWPSLGAQRYDAECQHFNDAQRKEIFVTPRYDSAVTVLGVLVHELGHACLGPNAGHGKLYQEFMAAIGLIGRPTISMPGTVLTHTLAKMAKCLGRYPHRRILITQEERKASKCRLLKVECPLCGYIARVTRTNINEKGTPICPVCRIPFEEDEI